MHKRATVEILQICYIYSRNTSNERE